ncbi:hypothetical protein SAMN02745243_03935 [Hespellia stercorisuis DSM 15480]|uniref:Uncharacterized protein n=1 Tax=Hespellia stercorisuis DSM 15480 TaxID=1121950 RepID=A0A1M6W527_9FIRM|nr:hypothetical protein SAMN02745243_03935 [Hespellia stercorisuis DSM 15480]
MFFRRLYRKEFRRCARLPFGEYSIVPLHIVLFKNTVFRGKYLILHVIFGPIDADVRAHANTYLMIVTASIPFIAFTMAGLQSSGHKVTLRYPCVYPS